VRPLTKLHKLRTVYLINTDVTDVTPLTSLSRLRELSLEGTSVPSSQVAALKTALPNANITAP
jgi:Leucine-rich repeat (LRR) protein